MENWKNKKVKREDSRVRGRKKENESKLEKQIEAGDFRILNFLNFKISQNYFLR